MAIATEGPRARPTRTPIRIAVLSYGLPRSGVKRGGIERVAHELADGLARRGHRVTVFSHDPAPPGARYAAAELPWRRFVGTWLGRRVTMGYAGNLLMLLPSMRDADVVVAHGDSLLLPLKRVPFVRVMHGSAWDEARAATSPGRFVLQTGVYLQELLSAATPAGVTVGVSENTRNRNPFVRRVIPNGVNREVFRPDECERARTPTIMFVGALSGRKRGQRLVDAFLANVRPALPGAELHVVSAAGPPFPGVTYHQGVSDATLAKLYRRAWVYASPSTYEGFGLPYVEALACGTPVLATPNAGSREVLGDGGGLLCSDDEFGRALLDLLRDPARRQALAAEGSRVAERYDMERTLDAYEDLLCELAARRARP